MLTANYSYRSVGGGANNFIIAKAPIAMVSGLFLRPNYGGSAKNIIPVRGIIPPFFCKVISSRRQGSLISLFAGVFKHLAKEVYMATLNRRLGGKFARTAKIIPFKLPTYQNPEVLFGCKIIPFPTKFSRAELNLLRTFAKLEMNPFANLAFLRGRKI